MKLTASSASCEGRSKLIACCGQDGPKAVAVWVPVYGSTATGRLKRRSPTLDAKVRGQRRGGDNTAAKTNGAFPNGIPRNLVVVPSVVPTKVPWSSWMVGGARSSSGAASASLARRGRRESDRTNISRGTAAVWALTQPRPSHQHFIAGAASEQCMQHYSCATAAYPYRPSDTER